MTVTGISTTGTDAGNYVLASTSATTAANITPLTLTVTATALDKVYDGTTTATVTLSDDRVAGDVFTDDDSSGNFADKNAANGKTVAVAGISISGTDAGNYVLASTATSTTADITPLTLTVTAMAQDKVYDGTTNADVTLTDNRVAGDVFTDADSSASFADKNVGNGKTVTVAGISITGTDAANYVLASTSVTTTANITPRILSVSAMAQDKVYDGTSSATVTLGDNRLAGDVFTDDDSSGNFADKNAANGKTVTVAGISITGTDAANYVLASTTTTTTANITPLTLTVAATAQDKVYDGTTNATVTLGDNRLAGDVFTDDDTAASFADKNVANGKTVAVAGISISGTDAGNYVLASTATSTTADITPLTLTITATAQDKVYDGTTTATVTLSDDRVAGDVFTDADTAANFADTNVGTDKTVTVTGISITGTDAGNYVLASPSATTSADITPRTLTVTAIAQDKVYDGTTTATVTLSDNRVAGDVFTDADSSANFADKNAGTGKTVTVTGISITGTDADNYVLASNSTTTTADITPLTLTVSATAQDKVYDGTTNATVTLTDNRVAGDVFTDDDISASFADKNVANGKTVSVAGISIAGTDAGNYVLASTATSTTADITPLTLTITATAQDKIYDGTTNATVTLSDDRVAGDVFTDADTAANFADKNVANGKTVTVAGISISGTDAGNYVLASTATSTTADITPLTLTVTAIAQDKLYDGTTNATVTLSDDRVTGDLLTDTDISASFADKNVANGKTVSVAGISITGTDAGNYVLASTTTSTTADITPLTLTVTAHGTGQGLRRYYQRHRQPH